MQRQEFEKQEFEKQEFEKQEFEKQVKAKAVTTLHRYIPIQFEILGDNWEQHHYTVADVIEETSRLASVLERMGMAKEQPEGGEMTTDPSVTTPTVTTLFLSDLITPWIQDIRQELFNTRDIPFKPREASNWAKQEHANWKNWLDEVKREIEKLPWWARPFEPPFDVLNKPSRFTQELDQLLGKLPLFELLYNRAVKVARVTGFDVLSVICHITVGTPLTLNKVDITPKKELHELPSGEELVNRFVTLQIRGELSSDELRKLYQQIRQDLGVKRSKAFNEKHSELYQVVRRKGGAPKGKGTVAFWESVQEDMNDWINKNLKGDPYTTWRSVQRAYDRLYGKLRNQWGLAKNP